MFTDRVEVEFSAGRGGDGVIAWRREKYIPKGGPTGGDGGKGGSVILRADANLNSLDWFSNHKIVKADNGQPGGDNLRKGKDGKTLIIPIPCGTLIKDIETGEVLRDMTTDGEEWIICKGGKGGYGNDHFKSPTHRAPYVCTPGQEGQACEVELELKLIADVGLVGFPNAGKSTLLSTLARIQLKTAAYPFTTLQPHLSFITTKAGERIYIADIPGIIEGAHDNRGLGLEFLRHIERTKLLLFLLDASGIDGRDPLNDYSILRDEIKSYNPELLDRPYLVVLNKIDDDMSVPHLEEFLKKSKVPKKKLFQISAVTGEGLDVLVKAVENALISSPSP